MRLSQKMPKVDLENEGHGQEWENRTCTFRLQMFESVGEFFRILTAWQHPNAQMVMDAFIDTRTQLKDMPWLAVKLE